MNIRIVPYSTQQRVRNFIQVAGRIPSFCEEG